MLQYKKLSQIEEKLEIKNINNSKGGKMRLRDKFWLWGHPEGRYNNNANNYGNMLDSRMTPMEGCLYLGINKK